MSSVNVKLHSPVRNGAREAIYLAALAANSYMSGYQRATEEAAVTAGDTVMDALAKLEYRVDLNAKSVGVFTQDILIPSDGWREGSGEHAFYADVPVENVTAAAVPLMNISQPSAETARECGLRSDCETVEGAIRVYASRLPDADILASLTVIAPGISGGVLPVASASSLGVVKVGSGLDIKEDGTLSVDMPDEDGNGVPDIIDENNATDAEVNEMLDEVYGNNP